MARALLPDNFLTFPGTVFDACDSLTGWTQITTGSAAGSSYVVDTVNFKEGTGCIKITTPLGTGSNISQLKTPNTSVRCTGTLGFWFYIEDYTTIDKISVFFTQDTGFANYWLTELTFATSSDMHFNGWRWLEFSPPGFGLVNTWGTGAGAPAFPNNYTNVQIRFTPLTGFTAVCRIDNLCCDVRQRPVLLITADDNPQSWFTLGIPELDSRGLKHTLGIIASEIGGSNQPTVANLQSAHVNGHDMSPHGLTNLSTLGTYAAIRADVEANINFLVNNGWSRGRSFYIYPNGVYQTSPGNQTILTVMRDLGFSHARPVISPRICKSPFGTGDQSMMLPIIGWNGDTVAGVLSRLDTSIKTGGVTTLMFHTVVTSGATGTTILNTDLQSLLDGIVKRVNLGLLDVLTISQYQQRLTAPRRVG